MAAETERDSRRGPSAETERAVLSAAFNILVNDGIAAITPTRLFKDTGVARTTIYRHWPDTSSIIADILAGATRRDDDQAYTGDLEADLRRALSTLVFRLNNRPLGPLLAALMDADTSAVTGQPLAESYVRGVLAPLTDVLATAIAAGQLPPRSADELAAEVAGPLLVGHLFLGCPATATTAAARVSDFLDRYAVAGVANPSR